MDISINYSKLKDMKVLPTLFFEFHGSESSNKENIKVVEEIYREGIPKKKFTKIQIEGAKKLYSILSKIGGKELVGNAKELSPGTFWSN